MSIILVLVFLYDFYSRKIVSRKLRLPREAILARDRNELCLFIHFFFISFQRDALEPSPVNVVLKKLLISVTCIIVYLTLLPKFSMETAKG